MSNYESGTRAVATSEATAVAKLAIFIKHRIVSSGIEYIILAYNGPPLSGKRFLELFIVLVAKQLKTARYSLQTEKQAERYYCTLMARIWQHVNDRHTVWDTFIAPVTHTCTI